MQVHAELRRDENVNRAWQLARKGAEDLPAATGRYFLQKVPVVSTLSLWQFYIALDLHEKTNRPLASFD